MPIDVLRPLKTVLNPVSALVRRKGEDIGGSKAISPAVTDRKAKVGLRYLPSATILGNNHIGFWSLRMLGASNFQEIGLS
jgi:hypothetical protein